MLQGSFFDFQEGTRHGGPLVAVRTARNDTIVIPPFTSQHHPQPASSIIIPPFIIRHQHRLDIAQTLMVHSPNDVLQSHKVSGQNSPRGRVGGQKSLKNPENPEKLSPGRGGGGTGVGDHFGTMRHISVTMDGTSPKLLW